MLRFAPSPIGDMHIDTLRIAILNYLVAQQRSEQLLVRIEDGNKEKNITGKDTEIMMILEKFALKHDAVFHQSEHLNLHQTLAIRLLKEGKAFVCKCRNEDNESDASCSGACQDLKEEAYAELKKSGEKFVVRIKEPKGEREDKIDAFIILKSDTTPSYDFACAADDMMSDITLVIREEEYLSGTAKQIYIKDLLGYENPTEYIHIPTISNNQSVKSLFEQGFIPDAILNYLLILGNPNAPKEIFTLPEAIEWFDLTSLSKSVTKFDMDKLRQINREHLRMIDSRELSTLFGFADSDIGELAKTYLEECSTINELEKKIRPIFTPKEFSSEYGEEMALLADIIAKAPAFESFETFKEYITNKSGLKEQNLCKPLRYLLTGTGDGPELSKIYPSIKSYILEVAS